jgi:DNA (cytosine-5)-methyltransferase 1
MNKRTKNLFTVGGLCSGVGGIELGFKQAKFSISWANDMDKNAMATYKALMGKNHYIDQAAMLLEDITKSRNTSTQLIYVDVLAAGFPCQAFSVAGYRKGFNDDRGNVFFKIRDVIKFLKNNRKPPRALLLENVKNFKGHDGGKTYDKVKEELEELGYSVYTKVLNTAELTTIPQNRERTFMVCFYGEKKWSNYQFDELKKSQLNDLSEKIKEKAKKHCPQTYLYHENFLKIRPSKTKHFRELLDSPNKVNDKYFITDRYSQLFQICQEEVHRRDTIYQYRRVYMRENKKAQCPTLTANMGMGGHNVPIVLINKKKDRYRKLTPKECFRFQGYNNTSRIPTDVADGQLYKQAGNSVTVPLIKKIALTMRKSLEL